MVQARKRARRTPASPRQAAHVRQPIDDLLDPGLFKALSDPTRLRLLACLAKCGRPCSVSEVAQCCSVDLSVVSRHLAALERARVLEATKAGRNVSYHVRFAEVVGMLRALAEALHECAPGDCSSTPNAPACCSTSAGCC
jgi:ArsR family transcriptional regulator, arsenate/arsenite/antimonite-responsive transcriptional repressor